MDMAGMKLPKWIVCAVVCTLSYICSLLYATDAGLSFLDAVDFYINFSLLLVGFFETFSAGWVFGIEEQVRTFGVLPVLTYMAANFLSVITASLIWFLAEEHNVWGGFVALGGIYAIFLALTLYLLSFKVNSSSHWTTYSILYEFTFGNVFYLAREMSTVVGFLPRVWAVLIKQFIPQILLILFINLAAVKNADGKSQFGHYAGYDMWPYQATGLASVGFALFIVLVGFLLPSLFYSFDETAHGAIKALDYTSTSDDESGDIKYSGADYVVEEDNVEKVEVNASIIDDDDDEFEVDC
jgi:solute carrier family 6 GABA transporter-like protein 1